MSKHKIRYILPLLAVMASAACVGAAGSSDKAANAVKPKQEKNLCPEPVDQMDEDCLDITLLKLENKLDMKYKDLFRRAATKDQKTSWHDKTVFYKHPLKMEGLSGRTMLRPDGNDRFENTGGSDSHSLRHRTDTASFEGIGTFLIF